MPSAAHPDVQHIQHLVHTYLGGSAERIVDRSPGFSGSRVYAVDVATSSGRLPCVVKLVPEWGDEHTWPAEDQVTNWVYGSHVAGFGAAYALLQHHAIPLPHLYAARTPQPELPCSCFLMERVPGDDVELLRARLAGTAQAQLDAVVGAQFGALHRITRAYAGWVDAPDPLPRPWRETFFTALHIILERACVHAALAQRRPRLEQTFDRYAAGWVDPAQYVLTHGDGLQALLLSDGDGWAVSGVIDIEDHRFSDPRFALAVYELRMEQTPLGDAFWNAYQQQCDLDSSYVHFRLLFQLYVLLDWLGNVPPSQPDTIKALLQQIDRRCSAAQA